MKDGDVLYVVIGCSPMQAGADSVYSIWDTEEAAKLEAARLQKYDWDTFKATDVKYAVVTMYLNTPQDEEIT